MIHQPVLEREVTDALRGITGGVIVDCTVGGGGHSEAILKVCSPDISVIGLDRDPEAVSRCRERLVAYGDRFVAMHASFGDVPSLDAIIGSRPVTGIMMDLGVSSFQLESCGRGFSFGDDLSLDMRFDPSSSSKSAAKLIKTLSCSELADLIFRFGEEPRSRRIARAITEHRSKETISTGTQLARIIRSAIGSRAGQRIHPATRTFQALRIAVNQELDHLQRGIRWAIERLTPAGRIAIISFHSLEDRLVKDQFIQMSGRCMCPPAIPECRCNPKKIVRIITRKPIIPTDDEIRLNPRSRSAKLRIAEKLESGHEE